MTHLGCSRTASACLLIALCGLALLVGTDPWLVGRHLALCVPIVAYVLSAHFSMMWAMQGGNVGVRQDMTRQGRLSFWHGVPVVLCLVWAAAGAFILWGAVQLQGYLGGTS